MQAPIIDLAAHRKIRNSHVRVRSHSRNDAWLDHDIAAPADQVASKDAGNVGLDDPVRDARGGHGAQFAVDELEFLSTAIAGPVEKFVDGYPRGSEFGKATIGDPPLRLNIACPRRA